VLIKPYLILRSITLVNTTFLNTEFPESLTIPEVLKVPDGNVFKFVLYGIGVVDYKFNASDATWTVCMYISYDGTLHRPNQLKLVINFTSFL
jgi:hypothetical protein